MVKIEHVAIWAQDIERLKAFYTRYFAARASEKYQNPKKEFQSYFLTFPTGARLELMQGEQVGPAPDLPPGKSHWGLAHIAFAVGSVEAVDALTQRLAAAGCDHLDGPRWTGDGYYESVFLDPEGNRIEITV